MSEIAPATAPRGGRVHRAVVIALPMLVLVQASLAGQHLFEGGSITLHGILGDASFALAVLGVILTVARGSDGRAFFVAVALMALAFAQVGLGYVGRETPVAAAWHIPLGVTIFGLATYQLARLERR